MDKNKPISKDNIEEVSEKIDKFRVGKFSFSDNIGVLCRGESLTYLPEMHSNFENCFLVSFQEGAASNFFSEMKGKKIVNMVNKKLHLMSKQLYKKLNIKDILVCESFREKIDLKIKLLKKKYNLNFIYVPNAIMILRNKPPSSVTSGELALIVAGFLGIKNVYVVGLDFCATSYFHKEKVPCKNWRNREKGMVLSLYKICESFPGTNFHLYTCYEKVEKKYDNLNIKVYK